jgi:hypothetical protein
MSLTTQQIASVAGFWTNVNFVVANATAIYSLDQIEAAATALDNAFDTTLNNAVTAVGGTTTVINGLAASIPAPFSGATTQQKTLLCCYVLMKRAGLI